MKKGVSIPNGMEFYARLSIRSVPSLRVSIPNGMEFYSRHLLSEPGSNAQFQFPTGWNSTERLRSSPAQIESFNSQRDGILPPSPICRTLPRRVSIPNGMEFYRFLSVPSFSLYNRFNSQRDGILLFKATQLAQTTKFQFPTGWNSTVYFIVF